jgi:ABC-type polysaccharide/polyol phosphate transport system ATPase subunit
MPDGRIEFHRVSKKFHRGELHDSLRDLVPALVRRMVRGAPQKDRLHGDEFWAVRDVSFTVEPGRALGIIGPNGAGKSTILKLLTGILRPTLGTRVLKGRVGALIEVSAGFHPDLTGRENVFLQGAVMGMTRREIHAKFDEIVAFSGLEEFMDTPVKRYSSGMHARLGFAIAVHLDPDVLVIDEVLAVGDFAFQRKAFERIAEMARRDIPVVIVSHQLEKIAEFCTDCILLDHGRVALRGTPEECISTYITGGLSTRRSDAAGPITLERLGIRTDSAVPSGSWVNLSLSGSVGPEGPDQQRVSVRVRNLQTGQSLCVVTSDDLGLELPRRGRFCMEVELQANLATGIYAVETFVYDAVQRQESAPGPHLVFQVGTQTGFHGTVNLHARGRLADPAAVA